MNNLQSDRGKPRSQGIVDSTWMAASVAGQGGGFWCKMMHVVAECKSCFSGLCGLGLKEMKTIVKLPNGSLALSVF
jgi:hypothetical protein